MYFNLYKTHLSLFLIFCFPHTFLFSQSISSNIHKYWNYRNRFINNFIVIGGQAGESIAFNNRNDNAWDPDYQGTSRIGQGEFGTNQGYYIATLATEYELLKRESAPLDQTLKELYYALYTINRVDLIAETCFKNRPPSLNGFFVRDDIPPNFVENHPELNECCLQDTSFKFGSGEPFLVNGFDFPWDVPGRDCGLSGPGDFNYKYVKTPQSLDQMLGLMIGLSFVNRFLDDNTNYQNKVFQDGETSLKKEAQNIVDRMISFAKSQNWVLKDPDGDFLANCEDAWKRKPTFFQNTANLISYKYIFGNIGKIITGKEYTEEHLILPDEGRLLDEGNQWFSSKIFNLRMYIEGTVMCNCFQRAEEKVINNSEIHKWTPFYYTMGILLHDWKKENWIKNNAFEFLNDAPLNGPYYHGPNDLPLNGWAASIRFDASLRDQFNGTSHEKEGGNYSGIDYMLLHNLYLLAYHDHSEYEFRFSSISYDNPYNGDFNGDKKVDLMKYGDRNISILINESLHLNVDFAYRGSWYTGSFCDASFWSVGDFNGDGKDDILKNSNKPGKNVYLSSGNSFENEANWTTESLGLEGFWTVGDFDGDSFSDALKTESGIGVQVLLSTGNSFQNPTTWISAELGLEGFWTIGDFNGDNRDDILRIKESTGTQVFLSNGTDQFENPQKWTNLAVKAPQKSWYVGDFNRDGRDDILRIVNRFNNYNIEVLLSNGNRFNPPQVWLSLNSQPLELNIGDINGDGASDIFYRYRGNRYGALAQPMSFKPIQID